MSSAERSPSIVRSRTGLHVEVEQLRAALPTFSYAPIVVVIGPQYYSLRSMGF